MIVIFLNSVGAIVRYHLKIPSDNPVSIIFYFILFYFNHLGLKYHKIPCESCITYLFLLLVLKMLLAQKLFHPI